MLFEIEEIASAIGGKILTQKTNNPIHCIVIQPNIPKAQCLYYFNQPVKDEQAWIKRLAGNRISCIVVKAGHSLKPDEWARENIGVIEVASYHSYYKLAAYYRSKFNIPFIEIVGSSGKTTTKDMIGTMLKEKFITLVGLENHNAPQGVAFNLCRLRDDYQAAVLEAGMSELGHISRSTNMIKPDIGVVTSLQRAHVSKLGSIENIIKAKSEILEHLNSDGFLLLNGEDENCLKFPYRQYKGKVYWFGFSDKFDIWASDIIVQNDWTSFIVHTKDLQFECKIKTFGKYNIGNALCAIFIGIRLGLTPSQITNGLAKFTPPPSRLQIKNAANNMTIINDNFNANPDSTKLLLSELPSYTKDRPVILVMGDMENPNRNEEYAKKVHFEIGEEIGKMEIQRLIAIGKWANEYINGAVKNGLDEGKTAYFKSTKEAEEYLKDALIPNSVIVFKASVYTQLQKLLGMIRNIN